MDHVEQFFEQLKNSDQAIHEQSFSYQPKNFELIISQIANSNNLNN